MQVPNNRLGHCSGVKESKDPCPLKTMLVSQIILFMFTVGKAKSTQHGLKEQHVLVPADLQKIQIVLPRNCNGEHVISLGLKQRLTDSSAYQK